MTNPRLGRAWRLVFLLGLACLPLMAQTAGPDQTVDPAAAISNPVLESVAHRPLPEQFIWLAMPPGTPEKTDQATPRYFRASFTLDAIPSEGTLYISGPDHVQAFLNGVPVAKADRARRSKTYPLVVIAPVANMLRRGRNVFAIEARDGSPLAVKIVPALAGIGGPAVFISGAGWKATFDARAGWEHPGFDDSAWTTAKSLGSVDTRVDGYRGWFVTTSNLEWNSDSEMYRWPGYDGISPYLAHLPLAPKSADGLSAGAGRFENISALTQPGTPGDFEVHLPRPLLTGTVEQPPSLVLDFGREINGRLEVISDSAQPIRLALQYGESREEALESPYLGVNELLVPPYQKVHGPKSAFRYVQLKFLTGTSPLRFKSIRLDAIYYPVQYRGSFESSDPLLDRIWAVGAYTAHLCMQDAIWDAPKRDRMPWMGDLDVSGHVIDTAFADHFLMQETMDRLIQEAGSPLRRDVNGIPGYSAFWVMGEADYYRHIGDKAYLRSIHDGLVRLLDFMDGELDAQNLFVNRRKAWPFVDWSPEFDKDTPEARRATEFEFYRAFSDGAWLLGESGDLTAARTYQARAEAIRQAAQRALLDPSTGTFGDRWQANAMAIYSGIADQKETAAIWNRVLSRPSRFMITPYYNYYVIAAMAQAGHRREALDWIRRYWGDMMSEGATSFWEGYDPSWPKQDFHASLRADDDKGYFVSLAHGWSSGPTLWLTAQILGIQPTAAGFQTAMIRPDLAGLTWARGSVPTPNGLIRVDYRSSNGLLAGIDVPPGVAALALMPTCNAPNSVMVNGRPATGQLAESNTRLEIRLAPGHYDLHSSCSP
ncbi:MAG TPA: alpha-L-rhamnosidase C-terminal domain-containing protein [Candidatus Cybelea sp.]|nr:alpha-L-rhamnosidase C-terminal domain-containing protein [Candidatus Cybelea sp.]